MCMNVCESVSVPVHSNVFIRTLGTITILLIKVQINSLFVLCCLTLEDSLQNLISVD